MKEDQRESNGRWPSYRTRELLAIVRACEEWYPLLLGIQSQVEVLTDHHALQCFMTETQRTPGSSGVGFLIQYRPRRLNAAADALSRKSEDLTTQKTIQATCRTRTLPRHRRDPRIVEGLEAVEGTPEPHLEDMPLLGKAAGDVIRSGAALFSRATIYKNHELYPLRAESLVALHHHQFRPLVRSHTDFCYRTVVV
jgi:hypothetical protein